MDYEYTCHRCGVNATRDFKLGKAPSTVKCKCGKQMGRAYNFSVRIPNPTHEARNGRGKG